MLELADAKKMSPILVQLDRVVTRDFRAEVLAPATPTSSAWPHIPSVPIKETKNAAKPSEVYPA